MATGTVNNELCQKGHFMYEKKYYFRTVYHIILRTKKTHKTFQNFKLSMHGQNSFTYLDKNLD